MSAPHVLNRIVARLQQRNPLDEADRAAIRAIPFSLRSLESATYLLREGETPEVCTLVLQGFAYRHKVTGDGERQILSVHMPGEFLDLQNSLLGVADHNVQTLTRVELAAIPIASIRALVKDRPAVGMAMWMDTLVDASIFREWIVNVGRRDSLTRISHLLCEFALRLRQAGLGEEGDTYDMPMTQEQIADAVGLTPVHVNRVLRELGRLDLIKRNKRAVTIMDWARLRDVGDFSPRYLHMQVGGQTPPQSAH